MAERLDIIITATDQTSNVFRAIERNARNAFGGIGAQVTQTGDRIASFGQSLSLWTAPLSIGMAKGVKVFSSFEDALAEIEARTGATGDEMDTVKEKALQMGAETVFSATDAANAMLELLASGYDLDETFTALPSTLSAAAAGNIELGRTADIVTDALAMWELGAGEAGRVADALARGAGASSAEIDDLAQGLGNVGPLASDFGLSLEDTIAILASFSERGIKGAEAGTQLKSMLTNMTRDTEKVTGMWEQLGISMFDAQGEVRPLAVVLSELRSSFVGMTDEEQIKAIQALAGSYGQLGLSVLTTDDVMSQMLGLMNEQADAATVAAARMDTLSGRTESLTGSLETLAINGLERSIESSLKPFIESLTVAVNKVNDWVLANPELTDSIVQMASALIAAGPGLFVAGKGIALIGRMITLVMNPLGLLVAGASALAFAWDRNLLGIQDFIKNALEPIQGWLWQLEFRFNQVAEALMGGDFSSALVWAQYLFDDLVSFLQIKIIPAIESWASEMVAKMVEWVAEVGPPLLNQLGELAVQVFDWIAETAVIAVEKLGEWGASFVEWVAPHIPRLVNELAKLWSAAGNWLAATGQKIGRKLVEWGAQFVDWVAPHIPPLIAELLALSLRLIAWIGDKAPGVLDKLGEWASAFVDWVVPAAADLLLELPGLLADVLGWILEVTPDIIEQILLWAAAFIDWVGPLAADLMIELGKITAAVIEWILSEWVPAIVAEIPGVVFAFMQFARDIVTEVGPALRTFLSSITNFITSELIPTVTSNARTIGTSIINGIKNGLMNVGSQIFNYLVQQLMPYANRELISGSGISLNNLGGALSGLGGALGIPMGASGGNFSGLFGVHDNEMVYAPGGARVFNPQESQNIRNNFNLTQHIYGDAGHVQDDFRMVEALANG